MNLSDAGVTVKDLTKNSMETNGRRLKIIISILVKHEIAKRVDSGKTSIDH